MGTVQLRVQRYGIPVEIDADDVVSAKAMAEAFIDDNLAYPYEIVEDGVVVLRRGPETDHAWVAEVSPNGMAD